MSEFEVETVIEARVAKKSKKVIWEYHVKWKGGNLSLRFLAQKTSSVRALNQYTTPPNPILPTEKFWERVDLNNRDRKNMTQFRVGESFVPVGPPRRKQSQRNLKVQPAPSPSPSAGPSKETTTRSSKRRRSSPPAGDLEEEKPAKRTRGRVTEPETRPAEEPDAPRQSARRPPAKSMASSTRSIRRTKKRTPSPDQVPETEEEEDVAMLVDPEPESTAEHPAPHGDSDIAIEAPVQSPREDFAAAAVASFARHETSCEDDRRFAPMDGAIATKARLRGQNGTSNGEAPVAGPSTTPRSRKPGPGRSSSGMLNKNTSSLLTFDKGALKTIKGKFKAVVAGDDGDKGEGSSGGLDRTNLGGLDSKAAEALDDFEDEGVTSPTADTTPSNANQENLTFFPPGTSMAASISSTFTSVWRRATIFGPLKSTLFTLKLDTVVIVPLRLTDIYQSLDTKLTETTNGPIGKFYKGANAVKLLDTVRTGGASARVVLRDDATEENKTHFARFRSCLDEGDLFTMMVGPVFLGFSSSNTPLMQRLNLPPNLAAFTDSVFLTELVIENPSDYLNIIDTADTSRW
ncbi:hypothetical protein C8R46DRAFT_1216200 [Mycena filopes]|nr:hypothetical protein C8R46DRAFT_1216200 [Mycena filopes]